MGDRNAQEFWDQMWYWEKYETFPNEQVDDPHLVVQLASEVEAAQGGGQQPDPELMRRYEACVGRVLYRLTNLLPRSGQNVDLEELKHWLRFGLDSNHRGHDGTPTPIIDANSLGILLFFIRHAREYCTRHQLQDLDQIWASVEQAAQEVENQHTGNRQSSRFSAGNETA